MARCPRLRDRERRDHINPGTKKRTKARRPQMRWDDGGECCQLHGTNEKVKMKTVANRLWDLRFHSEPFEALHHPCLCLPAGMEDVITARRGFIREAILVGFFRSWSAFIPQDYVINVPVALGGMHCVKGAVEIME